MRAPASHRLGQVSDKARSRQVARKLARSSLAPPPRPPPPPPNRHERKKKKKEKEERRRRKILRPPFFYVSRSLYIYIYILHIYTCKNNSFRNRRILLAGSSSSIREGAERYFSRGGEGWLMDGYATVGSVLIG